MMAKPKLSEIFDEAFKKVAEGRKPSEIIRLTGMPSATVYQKLKKLGLWHKGLHNQTHKNSIRKMRSENPRISVRKMSTILGLSYSTTHAYTVELEDEEIAQRMKQTEERTKEVIKRRVKTPVAKVVRKESTTVSDADQDDQEMEEAVEVVIEEAVVQELVDDPTVEETVEEEAVVKRTVGETVVEESVVQELVDDASVDQELVDDASVDQELVDDVDDASVDHELVGDASVDPESIVELAVVDEFIVKEVAVAERAEKLKERQDEAAVEELETVGEMLWTTDIDWAAAAEAEGEHP